MWLALGWSSAAGRKRRRWPRVVDHARGRACAWCCRRSRAGAIGARGCGSPRTHSRQESPAAARMSRRSGTPRKLLGAAGPSACRPAQAEGISAVPDTALELCAWLWHVTTGGGASTASAPLLSALRCLPLSSATAAPCVCLRVRAPNIRGRGSGAARRGPPGWLSSAAVQ